MAQIKLRESVSSVLDNRRKIGFALIFVVNLFE
jgi:hypothetical protein